MPKYIDRDGSQITSGCLIMVEFTDYRGQHFCGTGTAKIDSVGQLWAQGEAFTHTLYDKKGSYQLNQVLIPVKWDSKSRHHVAKCAMLIGEVAK